MAAPVNNPKELGARIRSRRKALGLTQTELAGAARTSLRFVSELERGKTTAQLAGIMRVLRALGLDLEVAARGEPVPEPEGFDGLRDLGDQRLRQALEQAGISFAYLFGSRASGTHRESSDADVAAMPTRRLGLFERASLANAIADALGVSEVDLVMLDEVGLELRGSVVQEGRLIFSADEPERVAFEVQTRSEYFDYLPTLEEHSRRFIRQVARRGLSLGRS